ncbi:hypothetical protein OR16_42468, partial [Cupriavidus basilensis OR16]
MPWLSIIRMTRQRVPTLPTPTTLKAISCRVKWLSSWRRSGARVFRYALNALSIAFSLLPIV